MSGWVKIYRGWFNDADFPKEAFSEREAWHWMIEAAAYEPRSRWVSGQKIELERGDFVASQRTLADVWGWGRQKVRRFLDKLEIVGKIVQNPTHGSTRVTICNYGRFQDGQPNDQPTVNPRSTHGQPIKEEGKEDKEGKEDTTAAPLAFEGRVIKLTETDFKKWQRSFHAIDLPSALQSRDDWLATQADAATRKRWFISTSNWLATKNSASVAALNRPAEISLC
jgi:hypothetical protein